MRPRFLGKPVRDRIVPVEDRYVLRALMQEDVLLGTDVLIHVAVNVQVVGREVGHDCDVG